MTKSVRLISEELGISKQAVYQRINSIPNFKKKYTIKVGNRLEITDEGVEIIDNFVNTDYRNFNQQENESDSFLAEQVKIKDEQLAAKDTQIKDLIKTLDQQQQLQLATTKENTELKQRIKRLEVQPQPSSAANSAATSVSKSSSTSDSTNDAPSASSSPHRRFWNFFKKR